MYKKALVRSEPAGTQTCIVVLDTLLRHYAADTSTTDFENLFTRCQARLTQLQSKFHEVVVVPCTDCEVLSKCVLTQMKVSQSAARHASKIYGLSSPLPPLFKECLKFPTFRQAMTALFRTFVGESVTIADVDDNRHFTHALFKLIVKRAKRHILIVCDNPQCLPFIACRVIPVCESTATTVDLSLSLERTEYYLMAKMKRNFPPLLRRSLPFLHMLSGALYLPYFHLIGQWKMTHALMKSNSFLTTVCELFNNSPHAYTHGVDMPCLRSISDTLTKIYLELRKTSCTDLKSLTFNVHVSNPQVEELIARLPPTDDVIYNHCARATVLAGVLFYDLTRVDRHFDNYGFMVRVVLY